MSRRTKRIILATVFLLLSAAAVGVYCTWTAPTPLRFRAIECQVVSNPGLSDQIWKVRMVMENTSHIPVHLLDTRVRMPRPDSAMKRSDLMPLPIRGSLQFDSHIAPRPYNSLLVPPGSSLECFFFVTQRKDPSHWLPHTTVGYDWISYTASKVDYLRVRLRRILPAHWRTHIPSRLYVRDRTPVDSGSLPPPIIPALVMTDPVISEPAIPSLAAPPAMTYPVPRTHRRRFFTAPLPPPD